MTLAQLAVTVALLGVLAASRFGLSAIPAYLLAGLLLGPNEPKVLSASPSPSPAPGPAT
jgi:Kef-type K+ transport system membrane component KefB